MSTSPRTARPILSPAVVDHPTVAVVVCTRSAERSPLLDLLVQAVLAELGPHDTFSVVVDRNPLLAAALKDRWSEYGRPEILTSTGRPGLSGARNTGLAAGHGEVVLFLDDDACPRPGWRDAVRHRFADPGIGIVAGAVAPLWIGRTGPPGWFPPEFGWVVGCDYRGLPQDGSVVRNPIGACMAVRRSVFDRIGGFDEELGRLDTDLAGCEETDLSLRAAVALPQLRIVRDITLQVDHVVPSERQRPAHLIRRSFAEGRSKAALRRRRGHRAALGTEMAHLRQALLSGWWRDLSAAASGDREAAARWVVSLAGTAAAAAGLVTAGRPERRPPAATGATVEMEQAGRPQVSVVVCTLGAHPHLPVTVRSLLEQVGVDLELIVVANGPDVLLVERALADIADPRMRIVPEPVPGLSRARNRGVRESRGPVVAFTDDDARAAPDWLHELVSVFDRDAAGKLAGVTGRVVASGTGSDPERWFELGAGFDKGKVATEWHPDGTAEHGAVVGRRTVFFPYTAGEFGSGNNMAFRREFLCHQQGFAVDLGAGTPTRGGEDLDMFRRVLLDGRGLRYQPTALVHHQHRATLQDLGKQLYAHGTGMAAAMTRFALSGPRPFFAVVRRLPAAARLLLHRDSTKNVSKPADYPTLLDRQERLGYLAGPWLLLRSVVAQSRRGPS